MFYYILFFIAILSFTSTNFIVHYIDNVSSVITAFYRLCFALPVYIVIDYIYIKRTNKKVSNKVKLLSFFLGFIIGFDIFTWVVSLNYTTIANSVLLGNIYPIFVVLLARYALKERVQWFHYVSIIFLILGVYITIYHDLYLSTENLWGDIASLITSVVYTFYLVGVSFINKKYKTNISYTYLLLGGIFILFFIAIITNQDFSINTLKNLQLLLLLSLTAQVIAQGILLYVLSKISSVIVASTLLIEIVLVNIVSYFILPYELNIYSITGAVIIIISILIINIYSNRDTQNLHH